MLTLAAVLSVLKVAGLVAFAVRFRMAVRPAPPKDEDGAATCAVVSEPEGA